MTLSKSIIKWYQDHKRNLPWRNTKDPYLIWVSEIIMQQTQVAQGLSYYLRFIQSFPHISSLYKASEDEVLKLWQGLGYYSRARNMRSAAKQIMEDYHGIFPNNYKDIIALKGIGSYTAAAISSFAYDLPYAVLDGNVYRVLARYYGIHTPINTSLGQKEFSVLAQEVMNEDYPAIHNNAMMEFGALQCKVSKPNCQQCPLVDSCMAFSTQTVNILPKKEKRLKIKNRYLHYFFLWDGRQVMIEKRQNADIWKSLYQLPLIETAQATAAEEVLKTEAFLKIIQTQTFHLKNITETTHKLTHRHLFITFYEIHIPEIRTHHYLPVHLSEVHLYAFPQPIQKYVEALQERLGL